WQILQLALSTSLIHLHSRSAYGTFSTVLGILAWFYLQAQITLYVVELDVVRTRQLWPRSLVPPPLTHADLRAYEAYAQQTQLRPEVDISVTEAVPAQRTSSDTATPHAATSDAATADTATSHAATSDTATSHAATADTAT